VVGIDRINSLEPCIDSFRRRWLCLAALPELTQIVSLDFGQAGFPLSWSAVVAGADQLNATPVPALRPIEHYSQR
jgi:hypothetical protein